MKKVSFNPNGSNLLDREQMKNISGGGPFQCMIALCSGTNSEGYEVEGVCQTDCVSCLDWEGNLLSNAWNCGRGWG